MNKKRKPEVGEVLYSLNIGNASRNREQELTPVEVTKVGNKYFYCSGSGHFSKQYYNDTWLEKTDYSPNSKLYEDPKDWEEEKSRSEIIKYLREIFRSYQDRGLSLETLKGIKELINKDGSI